MGWLKMALGMGSGISWITYAVIFGIGLAVGTSGAAYVQQLRLDAVTATVDSAKHDAAAAAESAGRWKAASDLRDQTIDQLQTAYLHQTKQTQAATAAKNAAEVQLHQTTLDSEAEQDAAADEIRALIQERQHESPQNVHRLSPMACGIYRGMYGEAACASAGAGAAPGSD